MTRHATHTQRRRQILEAAVSCFVATGYHAATMDDVARACGLSKGALYWYFPSKDALFRSLIEFWFGEFVARVKDLLTTRGTAREKLTGFVSALRENDAVRPELTRAQWEFYSVAARDPDLKAWFRKMYLDNATMLGSIIEEGIANGEFRRIESGPMARLIMAYIDGALLHRELFEPGTSRAPDFDEIERTLTNLLRA